MYILLAVFAFGVLIFVHELGHFLMAKACGVKVLEFSIGMGPQLLQRQKGETLYSLRVLPVGGYCAMEGEEEASEDPRAFQNHSVLHRLLILLSGSGMNFLAGFLLVLILYSGSGGFATNTIAAFAPGCPYEGDLRVGDAILSVNGHRIFYTGNFSEYASMDADGDLDLVIRRDGRRLRMNGYHLVPVEYESEDGTTVVRYGLNFAIAEATPWTVVKYSFYNCLDFVRSVWQSLEMLFTGRAGVKDMTGVVGIVDIINETGESAETVSQGLSNITFLLAFIAVNLAVMNLLPVPGLDGGHILTLLVFSAVEAVTGKKPDPRIEGYIHTAGLFLLLALMGFVLFNDITRIIGQ